MMASRLGWAATSNAKAMPVNTLPDAGSVLGILCSLLLVVALILGLTWLLRRFQGLTGGGGAELKTITALAVGQRERVVLVQVGQTQLLLGVAPGRVQTLHVLEQPLPIQPVAESFMARLQAMRKGGEQA
jgi:flagellar protein FliO/FliZ